MPVTRHEHVIEEYDWLSIPDYEYFAGWHEYRRFAEDEWEARCGPEWFEINSKDVCAELEALYMNYVKEHYCG